MSIKDDMHNIALTAYLNSHKRVKASETYQTILQKITSNARKGLFCITILEVSNIINNALCDDGFTTLTADGETTIIWS